MIKTVAGTKQRSDSGTVQAGTGQKAGHIVIICMALNSYSYKWQIAGKEMKNGTDSQDIE